MSYQRKRGIVFKNQYHIVFTPKYRRSVLVDGIDVRLKEILLDVAKDYESDIKVMEVMPDHVHIFIQLDPKVSIDKIIKSFKGRSAHILRSEFPALKKRLPCLWTKSYFCATIGAITEDTIKKYVEEQKNV